MINTDSGRLEIRIDRIFLKHNPENEYFEKSRLADGFIYYLSGGHEFIFNNVTFRTKTGDFLYLPYGSEYLNKLQNPDTEYYQFDFVLFENGHALRLFDVPHIFTQEITEKLIPYINKIYSTFSDRIGAYKLQCMGDILHMIALLKNEMIDISKGSDSMEKLRRTINYLEKYYYLDTSIQELAEMSYMSISNLEKLFRLHFKMTPAAYRNRIRIDHSMQMLSDGYSIEETAVKVGFCDAFYFSKMFKRVNGFTPSAYRNMNKGI